MATPRAAGAHRFSLLVQQAREPVFVLDSNHCFVHVNPAWEALTGRDAATIEGLACRPPGPERDESPESLGAGFCPPAETWQGQTATTRALIVRPSGERLWRRLDFWPLHDRTGARLGVFGVVRDDDEHPPENPSQRLTTQLLELREHLRAHRRSTHFVGISASHGRIVRQVAAACATRMPVLIVGERGSGKRQVARAIHTQGPHPSSAFIVLDAAALTAEMLHHALFAPAQAERSARFAFEANTTIVLGDLLNVSRDVQARLAEALAAPDDATVRVLSEARSASDGSPSLAAPNDATPRLLFTTTGSVDEARRADLLRTDLYYAATALIIGVPPLRERLDDLPLIAQHVLERANPSLRRLKLGISTGALDILRAYDWPGNLSELARVVEASARKASGDLIEPADLPLAIQGSLGAAYNPPPMPTITTPLDDTLAQVERRLIERALQTSRQRKSRAAAEILGISRPRLYRRMKELGIADIPEAADEPPAHATG